MLRGSDRNRVRAEPTNRDGIRHTRTRFVGECLGSGKLARAYAVERNGQPCGLHCPTHIEPRPMWAGQSGGLHGPTHIESRPMWAGMTAALTKDRREPNMDHVAFPVQRGLAGRQRGVQPGPSRVQADGDGADICSKDGQEGTVIIGDPRRKAEMPTGHLPSNSSGEMGVAISRRPNKRPPVGIGGSHDGRTLNGSAGICRSSGPIMLL